MGGVSGDKKQGIVELQMTADHGQYLGPFARILLAIAYVRDKDNARAREVLAALRDEFPKNPLFAREIARLDAASLSAGITAGTHVYPQSRLGSVDPTPRVVP